MPDAVLVDVVERRHQYFVVPPRRQICDDVGRYVLAQVQQAGHRGADCLPDRPAAVGTDEVVSSHGVLAAIRQVTDGGRDPGDVLNEIDHLVSEADHAGRVVLGALAQQWFETDLGNVG